jgi:hypothetical protein
MGSFCKKVKSQKSKGKWQKCGIPTSGIEIYRILDCSMSFSFCPFPFHIRFIFYAGFLPAPTKPLYEHTPNMFNEKVNGQKEKLNGI